jgi:putative DNA primase/helicase
MTTVRKKPTRSKSHGEMLAGSCTDAGNAIRFAQQHAADVRYCHAAKTWLIWKGDRWRSDLVGEAVQLAKATARSIYTEASKASDSNDAKTLANWATQSLSRPHLFNMLALAQSERGIPVTPEKLDSDPMMLNCANGTIDLRTGELRPHCREDLITKICPVAYDQEAFSAKWKKFLSDATGGDHRLENFLQVGAGYSLTGLTSEEVLFFVYGPAASGKSTFLESLKATLGDYACTADFETFLQRRFAGGPRNDVARLHGSRMVISIETDKGSRLAEGLVKQLTGGDTIAARKLYQESFEFKPQFKLIFCANDAPRVRDDDAGLWRRVLTVPFNNSIPKSRRDPALKSDLCDPALSGPAILAWMVEGCLRWQREGLQIPDAVTRATDGYRESQNPLKEFIDDCCELNPEYWTASSDLSTAYEMWSKESGETCLKSKAFSAPLGRLGLTTARRGTPQVRGWSGVRLLDTYDDPLTSDIVVEDPESPRHQDSKEGHLPKVSDSLTRSENSMQNGSLAVLPSRNEAVIRAEREAIEWEGSKRWAGMRD